METGLKHSDKFKTIFDAYTQHVASTTRIFRDLSFKKHTENEAVVQLINSTNELVRFLREYGKQKS